MYLIGGRREVVEGIEAKVVLGCVHDRREVQDEPVLERQESEMGCDLCELCALHEQHDQAKPDLDYLGQRSRRNT